jgi:hypothetical protein
MNVTGDETVETAIIFFVFIIVIRNAVGLHGMENTQSRPFRASCREIVRRERQQSGEEIG